VVFCHQQAFHLTESMTQGGFEMMGGEERSWRVAKGKRTNWLGLANVFYGAIALPQAASVPPEALAALPLPERVQR
jgi:hypothetical protein